MVRPSLLPVLALLILPACGAIWGLDEVTRAEGDGGGGGGATTSSTATSTSTTSTTSTTAETSTGTGEGAGGEGGAGCDCGCPSLFVHGAFETEDDVASTSWDNFCPKELTSEEGCGAIRLTGGSFYCAHTAIVTAIDAGGRCLAGRVRAKGNDGSWIIVDAIQGSPALAVKALDENLGPQLVDFQFACRLPEAFTVNEVYMNTNKAGESDDFVLTIDLVEMNVVDCEGTESDCPSD